MGRLIRMDFYRLIQSKVFWISLLIFSGLQFILNFFNGMFANYNAETIADAAHKSYEWHTFNSPITEVIETPILSLFIIVLFISIVSFCHADQANGYIKNIDLQQGLHRNFQVCDYSFPQPRLFRMRRRQLCSGQGFRTL